MAKEKLMHHTQIYLTFIQMEKLKEKSNNLGISLSELIRRILDNYLEIK